MATTICKKIFSPEVASQLNWTGTEIKKGIKSLKCGACIIGKLLKIQRKKHETLTFNPVVS